jgi:hypothetical protein
MRHFSCDVCGKALSAGDPDGRYVVRVEGFVAMDDPDGPDGLDADHVADMADLLAALEADPEDGPAPGLTGEYDLCPECYRRYRADPLGRDRRRVRFSPN